MELENNRDGIGETFPITNIIFAPKGFYEITTRAVEDDSTGEIKYVTYLVLEKVGNSHNRRGYISESFNLETALDAHSYYITEAISRSNFSWKWN